MRESTKARPNEWGRLKASHRVATQRKARRSILTVSALAGLTIALGIVGWSYVSRGVPPRTITMATGPEGGSYAELAEQYRAVLALSGVELRLVATAGAAENLAKLRDAGSGVSAALVIDGLPGAQAAPGLESLGTMLVEPFWLFERASARGLAVEGFAGKRISIGAEGSGTRAVAQKLLTLAGIDPRSARMLDLQPVEASERLLRGEIDAFALVDSWDSPVVRRMVAAPGISLFTFRRADAFLALNPYLSKVVLPAGVGDLATNRPPTDVVLLASRGSLVVRRDLHTAIQYLLLQAASQIHSRPGIFHRAGAFPALEAIDFPLSDEAASFHKSGRPLLNRYLPFWMAVLAERLLLVLIPLMGVVFPLLRAVPSVYRGMMQKRITSLYGELKFLELELETRSAGDSKGDLIPRLDALQERAGHLRVPLSCAQMLYTLKEHIRVVRDRIADSD
jgi:TRAP-type uncharacterized transport system substrate-binding protein